MMRAWSITTREQLSIIFQHIYFQISKKNIHKTSNFISLSKFENNCYVKSTKYGDYKRAYLKYDVIH